jgi:multiple sugar transport system substrate-binding protein
VTRYLYVFVLLALLLPALGGCALQATPPPEPVTIVFAHPEEGRETYEALFPGFRAQHPEITVELAREVDDKTDCYIGLPFDLPAKVEAGAVLSLDPLFEQDPEFGPGEFYPGALEAFRLQGKIWGVPETVDEIVLYYNKDMFDQAGVPYPQPDWTWDDFVAATSALSDPENGIFGYVMPPQGELFDAILFVYGHGGRLFDSFQSPSYTTFDDPKTIEAVQWYTDLALKHHVAPTPEQIQKLFGGSNWRTVGRGVLASKFAMWMGTYSDHGGRGWGIDWPMKWGIAPWPRDEQSLAIGYVRGYFINATSQHPDACWDWITFLSQQPSAGLVPARKSVAESNAFREQMGRELAATVLASMRNIVLISPDLAQEGDAVELFDQAVRDALQGTTTPEEALRVAQERARTSAGEAPSEGG